jgi:hypothetical protein
VGRSDTQNPKGATTTLQRIGDLHDMEHLEGKNRRIFQDMVMDARQVALKAKDDINTRCRVLNNLT